jgi:pimeloyl-ACP methyl ester carboxylesterase
MYYGMTLWGQWSQITCPILILRGTNSDFLPSYLATEMLRKNANARLIEFDRVGHMPMLMDSVQIEPIVEFFAD